MSRAARWAAAVVISTAAALSATAAEFDLEAGRTLYATHCEKCHGPEGAGDGSTAEKLGIHPRDFRRGAFKCRSTPSGSPPTDADLYRSIARGLPGSAMLRFGHKLDPAEIEALVAYTRQLSGAAAGTDPPAPIAVPEPPEPSSDRVAEGRQVYRALGCWRCHGAEGDGDGPMADAMVDSWGEPIAAHDFTARGGRFKCGGEPTDLYRTLHTGITGSPMPSYSEAFAFAAEDVAVPESLTTVDPEAPAELERYLAGQPDRGTTVALAEPDRRALVEHRTWALVYYLLSLAES